MPAAARRDTLWHRFLASWRNFGARYTLYHLMSDRLLPPWLLQFGRLTIWERRLGAAEQAVAEDPDVQPAPDDRAALLAEMPEGERAYWRVTVLSGMPIRVLRRDGRLVGFVVSKPESCTSPPWLRHVCGPRDIWGYGVWVAPEERGGGIASHMMHQNALASLRDGYVRRVGIIEAGHRSSIRATRKAPFTQVGRVAYLRVFGFAVVRAGQRCFVGRCDAARPLSIPIECYDRPA
jgi:L-amino acid N-acyltransferase YncA